MTFNDTSVEDTDLSATDDSPVGDGQAIEAQDNAEREFLDTSDYSSHYVRVKVDGEELEVPLSEALNGYSRQEHFTRKSQQLAQAQAFYEAWQANPYETIQALGAQLYGDEGAYDDADEGYDEEYDPDPYEEALYGLNERLEAFETAEARRALDSELAILGERYGADFDPREVVGEAMRLNTTDLEAVAKSVMFDKWWARKQGEQDFNARNAAEDAQRQAAAQAAGIVSSGGSAGSVGVDSAAASRPKTIAEAYQLAKQQHGG